MLFTSTFTINSDSRVGFYPFSSARGKAFKSGVYGFESSDNSLRIGAQRIVQGIWTEENVDVVFD